MRFSYLVYPLLEESIQCIVFHQISLIVGENYLVIENTCDRRSGNNNEIDKNKLSNLDCQGFVLFSLHLNNCFIISCQLAMY